MLKPPRKYDESLDESFQFNTHVQNIATSVAMHTATRVAKCNACHEK
jgi:hypothetical protein